jgi:hypothetical protein
VGGAQCSPLLHVCNTLKEEQQFQLAICSAYIIYLSAIIYVLSFRHWLVFLGAHSCLVA